MSQVTETIAELVDDVLGPTALHYTLDSHTLREDFEAGHTLLECQLHDRQNGARAAVRGQGLDLTDAFLAGLVALHGEAAPSLQGLQVAEMRVRRLCARAEVSVTLLNAEGQQFSFAHTSPSLTHASLQALLQGVEFFLNCERAFMAVHRALQHAREERRPDSVALYTGRLAVLVQATSYSVSLQRISSL